MKKIKVYCKNNSSYQATYQRGNTLVPVIISLAISAIATIAFLNQGANLSQKNKILMAQNEIARAIQQWNIARQNNPIVTPPRIDNAVFGRIMFHPPNSSQSHYSLSYRTDSPETCRLLSARFSSQMDGISSNLHDLLPFMATISSNPGCPTHPTAAVEHIFVMRLED